MAILDEFDPQTNGWFFENWGETAPFSWDLFRRTYLAINPTQDVIAAPDFLAIALNVAIVSFTPAP